MDEKTIRLTIQNLGELLDREFEPGEIVTILLLLEGTGVDLCEVTAKWDKRQFELIGDRKRRIAMKENSNEQHEIVWEFRTQSINGPKESRIEFWATAGTMVQAASTLLRRKLLK